METVIPALATPVLRAFALVFVGVAAPQPAGWAFVVMSIGVVGAILRRHRA